MGTDRRPVGASTITQQVAKNFLLGNEVSLARKVQGGRCSRSASSRAYSKDRILELYLNEIYLGAGTYGVAAAALNYFNKPLDELTHRRMRLSRFACPRRPTTTTIDSIPRRRWRGATG